MTVFWMFVSLLLVYQAKVVAGTCAYFRFPALAHQRVTALEHSLVTVNFSLVTDSCPTHNDYSSTSVYVAPPTVGYKHAPDYCVVDIGGGRCWTRSEDRCFCQSGTDEEVVLTKNVTRADSGTWVWRTGNGISETAEVNFDIHYPAQIAQFQVNAQKWKTDQQDIVLAKGTSILVKCHWRPAHPVPADHPLAWIEMAGRILSEQINPVKHELMGWFTAKCENSGPISCVVAGANEKKSRNLIVPCPIEFYQDSLEMMTLDASEGVPLIDRQLSFNVQSNTHHLVECHLTKLPITEFVTPTGAFVDLSKRNSWVRNCLSSTSVTGTPPNMTLTLSWPDVTPDDAGEWRLEVTNTEGPSEVNFTLEVSTKFNTSSLQNTSRHLTNTTLSLKHDETTLYVIPESDVRQNRNDVTEGTSPFDTPVGISIIVGAVNIVTVIVVIIIIVQCRRSKKRRSEGRQTSRRFQSVNYRRPVSPSASAAIPTTASTLTSCGSGLASQEAGASLSEPFSAREQSRIYDEIRPETDPMAVGNALYLSPLLDNTKREY